MTNEHARLIQNLTAERLVTLGEIHGDRYDAWGDPQDLELAVAYEKAAFELRADHSNPLPSAA